jgi:hypothetical protein
MAKFTGSLQNNKVAEMERYLQLVKSPSKLKQAEDAKKKKTPWYKKIISVLTTGETGQAAYDLLEGKNPVTSYGSSIISSLKGAGYDKRTYADVLEKVGMKKTFLSEVIPWMYNDTGKGWKFKKNGFIDPTDTGTLGLALDVLGDPTTYMAGIGIFKRIGRGLTGLTADGIKLSDNIVGKAEKHILKKGLDGTTEGIKIMNKAGEVLGESLKKDPDKYFKGFTFAGKEIIPRKYISAVGRYAEKSMSHVPILNKTYEGAKYGVQDVFKLGADVVRKGKLNAGLAGEITAERFVKNKAAVNKLIRNANDQAFNTLNELRDGVLSKTSKEDRDATLESLVESIERQLDGVGVENLDKGFADNLIKTFDDFKSGIYGAEKEALERLDQEIYTQISGYMPHTLTPEAKKMFAERNKNIMKLQGWKNWSTKSEKSRNLYKFVSDSGEEIFGSAAAKKLKAFSRAAEETFLSKKADNLIERRFKEIGLYEKELAKLDAKKLKETLKATEKELPKKIAELKVKPKGTPVFSKAGQSPRGFDLYRKSFTLSDKYKLKTAELQNKETIKFIEAMINTPSKEIKKLDRIIESITGKKIPKLGDEITAIKKDLANNIDDLPQADRWFVDNGGKKWFADRTMTVKEINEMMQESMDASGQVGKKFLITDPFEMMLSRGIEANRKIQYLNFMADTVQNFGRQGEVTKKYIRNPSTRKTKLKKEYASFTDPKTGIKYIDPKIPELPEGKLLPEFIVEDMKKTSQLMGKEELPNKLLRAYDRMMRTWKGSVYGWYPASHGRNFIGGSWNNFLANPKWGNFMGKTKDIIGAKDGKITLNGTEYTLDTVRKQIGEHQILGQTGYLDVNEMNKAFNKKWWEKVETFPMKASTLVENNLRVPLFLAEVDSGKSFKEAAKTVYKYHFDYAPEGLTKIERDIFKRFIPFYTWNRKNVPLMMEEMIAQPAKMHSLFKSMNAITDDEGKLQMDLLPSGLQYLEKAFPISKGGTTIPSSGLPPVEMLQFLNDPRAGIESGLTPALKIPIELRTGYNLFKDKLISEDTNGEFARGYPQSVRDFLEWEESSFKTKDGKEVTYSRVNPIKKYWLYALPTGRMAGVLSSVLSEEKKDKVLKGIAGINTFEFDMDELKAGHDREYEKLLQEILESSGVYSKYGTPFKSSKAELGEL